MFVHNYVLSEYFPALSADVLSFHRLQIRRIFDYARMVSRISVVRSCDVIVYHIFFLVLRFRSGE